MPRKFFQSVLGLMLVFLAVITTGTQPVHAIGIVWYVTPTGNDNNDCLNPSTACATINGAIGKTTAGDTVNVAIGTYISNGAEVVLIDKDLTLLGGWDINFTEQSGMSTVDGQSSRRGITINSGLTVNIERLIVQNGSHSWGGGIANYGILTLSYSSISNNASTFLEGGGIANYNTLYLNRSTIRGNKGDGWGGGGIYTTPDGNVMVNNSTIIENSGIFGGGVYVTGGTLTLANSIIANNVALGYQGGADCNVVYYASAISNGNNILGDCAIPVSAGDQINVDPLLGTYLPSQGYSPLLAGSPAIDAGNFSTCLPIDQRGVDRGSACDIGAYEYTIPGPVVSLSVVSGSGQRTGTNSTFLNPLQAVALDSLGSPVDGVAVDFTAPESGASGTFVNTGTHTTSAVTGVDGIAATSLFTANNQAGAYTVLASSVGVSTAIFDLEQVARPLNDSFADAIPVPSLPFNATVDNTEATSESGEVSSCGTLNKTVWYSFTPTQNVAAQLDMAGSVVPGNINIYLSSGTGIADLLFTACGSGSGTVNFNFESGKTYYLQVDSNPGQTGVVQINLTQIISPENDNFTDAKDIVSLPFSDSTGNSEASIEYGEPQYCFQAQKTVWYSFTPMVNSLINIDMAGSSFGDTNFNVYQSVGTGIAGLSFLQCASYSGTVSLNVQAGVTYYIQAGSIDSGGGNLQLNLQEIPRPVNDDFANAKVISSPPPFDDTIDTISASVEGGEPQPSCANWGQPGNTIWYAFTPSTNGLAYVHSPYISIFPLYAVYSGNSLNSLTEVNCGYGGNTIVFHAFANTTYYIQVGNAFAGSQGGLQQIHLELIPSPANDDFANAITISSQLPFDNSLNTADAGIETGEPTPTCAYNGSIDRSVWYVFTPTTSGSVTASVPSSAFMPVFAAYTGNSLAGLTQVGCQAYNWNVLTFHVNAGTTYYFHVGNLNNWEQGGSMQFHLDVAPSPVANFNYHPSDPSVFDTIQFFDYSNDPGQAGFQSFAWNFGDGNTGTGSNVTHQYTKDGDYTVQHSATTIDGRIASTTQVVHVKTHDVAITKINAPQSASSKQTRTITVSVNSKTYAETVQIDLYKSVVGGFEYIGSITQLVPVRSTNQAVTFNFSYIFTSSDASIGKVTFKAVAVIVNARDSYPSDNEAISSPPTRVPK